MPIDKSIALEFFLLDNLYNKNDHEIVLPYCNTHLPLDNLSLNIFYKVELLYCNNYLLDDLLSNKLSKCDNYKENQGNNLS